MATITDKRASGLKSIQELERIEGFSNEPFYIADTVSNVIECDSIEIDSDATKFDVILAKDGAGGTYNYLTQCNILTTKEFNITSSPLVSPFGFHTIKLSAGAIRVNR